MYEFAEWGIQTFSPHRAPQDPPPRDGRRVWGLGSGLACSQLNCLMGTRKWCFQGSPRFLPAPEVRGPTEKDTELHMREPSQASSGHTLST